MRKQRSLSLVLALTVWMTSCTTPEAVRKFTAAAKDSTALFPPVARDITASCIRTQLAERPLTEIADVGTEAMAACKPLADQEPNLLGALKVLTAYFGALNELAAEGVASYDKEIDQLAASIQSAGALGAPEVQAVKGLAKFLFNAAASGYQRKHLGRALKDADADVAVLTRALGKIVGTDYDRLLRIEQDALRTRYREALVADKNPSTVAQALLQDRWRADLATLDGKRRAAKDVVAMLEKIREGHHKLAEQVDHWSTAEFVKTLNPYTANIRGLAADFRTAF
uniref:Lipoprotein n=1 Tax=Solibacter usitatus (strain Ellin6076) TaxID=234267 RepID=Q01ZZ3_SOLUE